jgi:DNA repair exonuclease SbcCD ATPase subunit
MGERKFRGSLLGFRKQDVIGYIEKVAEDAKNSIEANAESLKSSEKNLEEARRAARTAENEIRSLREECERKNVLLDEAEARCRAISEETGSLKAEIARLKDDLALKNSEYEYSRVTCENQRLRLSEMEKDLEQSRDDRIKVADIIIAAQRNADRMKEWAEQDAREVREKAESYLANLKAEFGRFVRSVLELKQRMTQNSNRLEAEVEEIYTAIDAADLYLDEIVRSVLKKDVREDSRA